MSRYYTIAEARTDGVDNSLGDVELQKVINEVEALFESITDRRFDTRTLTLYFDGDGSTMLYFRDYPIVSISSLKIDDAAVASGFYAVYNDKIEIIQDYDTSIYTGSTSYAFTKGNQNIEVTGIFGYATDAQSYVLVKRVIRLMTGQGASGSLTVGSFDSEKVGDYSYRLAKAGPNENKVIFGAEIDTIIRQLKRKISIAVI